MQRQKKYSADEYVYVVDQSQFLHFDALKKILAKIGETDLSKKVYHLMFGRVHGLSTRLFFFFFSTFGDFAFLFSHLLIINVMWPERNVVDES